MSLSDPEMQKVDNTWVGTGTRECVAGRGLRPGLVVSNRYRVGRLIGAGGMSLVYEAEHLLLGTCVALKVLRPELFDGANLFLASDSAGHTRIKVIDFGIARSTSNSPCDGEVRDVLLGSPPYAAPEQFESARDIDARTDVWAVGVVLFEMLAGRSPFDIPADSDPGAKPRCSGAALAAPGQRTAPGRDRAVLGRAQVQALFIGASALRCAHAI